MTSTQTDSELPRALSPIDYALGALTFLYGGRVLFLLSGELFLAMSEATPGRGAPPPGPADFIVFGLDLAILGFQLEVLRELWQERGSLISHRPRLARWLGSAAKLLLGIGAVRLLSYLVAHSKGLPANFSVLPILTHLVIAGYLLLYSMRIGELRSTATPD